MELSKEPPHGDQDLRALLWSDGGHVVSGGVDGPIHLCAGAIGIQLAVRWEVFNKVRGRYFAREKKTESRARASGAAVPTGSSVVIYIIGASAREPFAAKMV